MILTDEGLRVVLIGLGATAVMDVWSWLQQRLGIPTLDYAMLGRWVGHLCRGEFAHGSIGKAEPIPGERALGWTIHYATGISFAMLLVAIHGQAWLHEPECLPALAVGIGTVAIPFFVMQPGMGIGIAASRTPNPWKSRLRSVLTHAVFGAGLYLSAVLLKQVWQS